jgi:hypothetical protein
VDYFRVRRYSGTIARNIHESDLGTITASCEKDESYLNATIGSMRMADDLFLFVKVADSSHELERSDPNPFCSEGRIALCISLDAKSLHDVDAGGAGGRQPRRDDRGRQQHERREDHGQGARHLHV